MSKGVDLLCNNNLSLVPPPPLTEIFSLALNSKLVSKDWSVFCKRFRIASTHSIYF